MDNENKIVSLLDLLDLDEELVDTRLKSIMKRSSYTNEHLANALQLLQYKLLINRQENTDCSNSEEFEFIVKLIKHIQPETTEKVCKIVNTVLKLNSDNLVSYSEHLLQQILSNIDEKYESTVDDADTSVPSKTLMNLKICDSVLDAVVYKEERISLLMLELPLENILKSVDETLKIHFVTNTVPRLFEGTIGYNILDKIWEYIVRLDVIDVDICLKILSCLSEFYLPSLDSKMNNKFESDIVKQFIFWNIILNGLMSTDFSLRKMSVYLAKRAIDYITNKKINVNVMNEVEPIFLWDNEDSITLRNQWDNYFILLDSLEEKQSNIVLPSLQLFDVIYKIPKCWLNCAFNLGLKHDNSQVRLKSIEHRLKIKIDSILEAKILLEALDDFSFYDDENSTLNLKKKIDKMITDENVFILILKAIPTANITPVPLYHITDILANVDFNFTVKDNKKISEILIELFKVPCNIVIVRKAVHLNILEFVGRHYKQLHWSVYITIASILHIELQVIEDTNNPFANFIKSELILCNNDKKDFFECISKTHTNIEFAMLYSKNHKEDLKHLNDIVNAKVNIIKDIVNRQYSNKMDCYKDVIFLLKLYSYSKKHEGYASKLFKEIIENEFKMLYQYMFNLLTYDTVLHIDEVSLLFECFGEPDNKIHDVLIETYKNCAILLKYDSTELDKAILCMFFINNLSKNITFRNLYRHEMLSFTNYMEIIKVFENKVVNNAKNLGRSRNVFYEKHMETLYLMLEDFIIETHINEIVHYVEKVIETGGYGCLIWILRIINKVIDKILNASVIFNVIQFINRMWQEIEELKTNHQYAPCMREFVKFITHDTLLVKPDFNNTIILYCNKLIEYGHIKNSPLFYLVEEINLKSVEKHGHMVYVLSEILLYCPVPKKDQRIADNLAINILRNPRYGLKSQKLDLHFTFEIQYLAVLILSKISDDETLDLITSLIMTKIDNIFKAKVRYHGNSQIHRTLQTGLQILLLITLLKKNINTTAMLNWTSQLLGKLPHQVSVRILLEWHVSLSLYLEKRLININLINQLKSKNIPLQSQFVIIYWLLKRKISNNCYAKHEYDCVLDTLLGHTMGQMFNVRLQAQYLATKIYNNDKKYEYTIGIINRTLADNSNDKNFVKLKEDYFVNEFDIISDLSTYFIYHLLPKLCDVGNNETVNEEFIINIAKRIDSNAKIASENDLKVEWSNCYKRKEEYDRVEFGKIVEGKLIEDTESVGTIQKKYIPWKSMSDVNSYCVEKKKESHSDLIVVASLIDKLPNLGGMARTSEVFGVKTYVVDSLRHLQDKQFQGLSVSAERWVNIKEVRPGQALKNYLTQKKCEGYSVVAAEQTSTSTKLQAFKFPKKTLLLLGHEKEGVPSDLLPMMDHCVEIPQQGYVRSLNVHVTAAIFVWEYTRQNIL